MTKYRLSALSGVSNAILSELCSGKTKNGKCSVETIYKIAKALHVPMKLLVEDGVDTAVPEQDVRKKSYGYGIPEYLQHDLDAYKEGIREQSSFIGCLWGTVWQHQRGGAQQWCDYTGACRLS